VLLFQKVKKSNASNKKKIWRDRSLLLFLQCLRGAAGEVAFSRAGKEKYVLYWYEKYLLYWYKST
jgi:hypothetical protein